MHALTTFTFAFLLCSVMGHNLDCDDATQSSITTVATNLQTRPSPNRWLDCEDHQSSLSSYKSTTIMTGNAIMTSTLDTSLNCFRSHGNSSKPVMWLNKTTISMNGSVWPSRPAAFPRPSDLGLASIVSGGIYSTSLDYTLLIASALMNLVLAMPES